MRSKGEPKHSSSKDVSPIKVEEKSISAQVAKHVAEIRKRRLGYGFGGPDPAWCESPVKDGIPLPDDPNVDSSTSQTRLSISGCLKYQLCDLIPKAAKWRPWEALSEGQREALRSVRCYRATRRGWDWDKQALPSRNRPDGRWIANPFGIRSRELANGADATDLWKHPDFSPCPVGGCVTPEMERDYRWYLKDSEGREGAIGKTEFRWSSAKACPFFYRHTDETLATAVPNPQRFTQCYVTLPEVRQTLEQSGFVVAAPIFRSTAAGQELGEAWWYPFYSGFSFVQLPTRAPREFGWTDPTLPLRWQATYIVRSQQTYTSRRDQPIQGVFTAAEMGDPVSDWESKGRVISISEGMAVSILLQWVVNRRLEAAVKAKSLELVFHRLGWEFAIQKNALTDLAKIGYEVKSLFALDKDKLKDKLSVRQSTLMEDLQLLRLAQPGRTSVPAPCLSLALKWLRCRTDLADRSTLANAVRQWIGPAGLALVHQIYQETDGERLISGLCWVMLAAACRERIEVPRRPTLESLMRVDIKDPDAIVGRLQEFEQNVNAESYARLRQMVPPFHLLIRVDWPQPLRWFSIPLSVESRLSNPLGPDRVGTPRIDGGLLVTLQDEERSQAYHADFQRSDDQVLKRLDALFPLLDIVAQVEGQHVREEFIQEQKRSEVDRLVTDDVRHLIRNIRDGIASTKKQELKNDELLDFVGSLVAGLELRFTTLPEKPLSQEIKGEVNLANVAHRAVLDFNAYYPPRYGTIASLHFEEKDIRAKICPVQGTYEGEPRGSIDRRASADLEILLLQLLVERVPASKKLGIELRVFKQPHNRVTVEAWVKRKFDESKLWDSSTPLTFPRGRGLYLTFKMAKFMGSSFQEVRNEREEGVVRIDFEGGDK